MSTPTDLGYTKDIYVSIRTDGMAGSGLEDDPYNVSTAGDLDNFMVNILPLVSPGCHVHFAAGTYLTNGAPQGSLGFNLPGGNWYEGAGMWQSTIKQTYLPTSGQICMFQTLATVDNKNTRISGFTFDTNWPTLGAGSPPTTSVANWIEIDGTTGIEVDHCAFINGYGNIANNEEHFGCKIAPYSLSGTPQPMLYSSVHDCYFGLFQGDYGSALDLWSYGASGTTVQQANCAVYNNYFDNYNALNFGSNATNNNGCGCLGVIGQGFDIHDNQAYHCARFLYVEGPNSDTRCHDNILLDCMNTAHVVSDVSTNVANHFDFQNEFIEMSTEINGSGDLANNPKAAFAVFGNGSVTTNHRIRGCTITKKVVGYTTATRSHSGTTATITFSTAPGPNSFGFVNGQVVDTSLFGDSRYDAGFVSLTRNSATSYSYTTSASFSESSTADTTGTVIIATTGIGANMPNPAPCEISGNQVDSGLYNNIVYTAPMNLVWHDNLTETGAPITLAPNLFHSLPSVVSFPATNNATMNGNNLIAANTHASLIYPNAAAPSATNPITILLEPGNYNLGATGLTLLTQYLGIVGKSTNAADQYIYSSTNTITLGLLGGGNLLHPHFANLSIYTSSSSSSVFALYNNSNGFDGSDARYSNLILNGAGTLNSVGRSGSGGYNGVADRITFVNGGMFAGEAQSEFNGTITNFTIGSGGTNNLYLGPNALLSDFSCTGQLNLFRNDGVIQYGKVAPSSGTTDAIYEQNNGANGGITRYCTLIPSGTGSKPYKNVGGPRSTAIVHCEMPVLPDTSITNLVATPYNVVDSNITQ